MGGVFGALCIVLFALAVRKERKRRRERILGNVQVQSTAAKNLAVLARVLPALMGDVRVFIGVYQTLTNMGTTLAVEFPENVEVAIDAMKELVNIDLFSFGAVSCVVSGSFYTKLWLSLLLPAGIELGIYLKYDAELKKQGLNNLPDTDDRDKVRSHLSELHNKRRIAAAKARNAKGGGFFSKFKRGTVDAALAEEDAEEHQQRAFENDRELRRLFRKLDKKAELQQATIGWSFFVIFLAYPAVTNKIFALFYCYEIDANTAFLMTDYSVDCRTWTYYFHYFVCAVFVIFIPVGIPVYFYRLVNAARTDIIDNHGPHHLENLYLLRTTLGKIPRYEQHKCKQNLSRRLY
jgi:multisubunit Na+/H+ antiporter MnhB subunit